MNTAMLQKNFLLLEHSDWEREMPWRIGWIHQALYKHCKTGTKAKPTDTAVEALRGLRTSMHFAMLDATRPFADSVRVTIAYLEWRSVGGALMTAGHLLLGVHILALLARGSDWVPQTGYHPRSAVES